MDCSSLRTYLKSELPNYDETKDINKEQLMYAVMSYFSHKGMEMTKDDEAVIDEYGGYAEDYFNFDEDQLSQLEAVEEAAQNLIDVLCNVPDYLKNTWTQDGTKPHPYVIAEAVAGMLHQDMSCVFFPTHGENPDGVQFISDLYQD